jgi:hypothetical protein
MIRARAAVVAREDERHLRGAGRRQVIPLASRGAEGELTMFKQKTKLRRGALAVAVAGAWLATAPAAHAGPVDWTDWTAVSLPGGTASGVITPSSGPAINVSLTGPNAGGSTTETFPFGPAATYIGGIVSNAPCSGSPLCSGDLINLPGTPPGTNTLTFSSAVLNPVFAVWSLGDLTTTATLTLPTGTTPIIESTGPNAVGFGSLTASGNVVSGQEGNGTFLLPGTFSSITFTLASPSASEFAGITVGQAGPLTAPVPEPATYALFAAGLAALGAVARRRARR